MNVAVVIPCHSHPQFLPEALESVYQQRIRPGFISLVLDGPPKEQHQIYEDLLPYFRVDEISLYTENHGVSFARNCGFQRAIAHDCEWVIPLDEDDILHPDYVKEMMRSVEVCPDRPVHYCDWNEFGTTLDHHSVDDYSWERLVAAPYIISTSMIHVEAWKMVRERNGTGYDEELSRRGLRWEDYLLYLELGALGFKFARVGKGLVRVRRHGPSGTDIANATIPEWRAYAKDKLKRLYGVDVPW